MSDQATTSTGTAAPPAGAPPQLTAEEYRRERIEALNELIEALEADTTPPQWALPATYTEAVRMAKRAWENGEVSWEDGRGYLWGPEGLVASGNIKDVDQIHLGYWRKGKRDYHHDKCEADKL
ncbi:hypothetical protein TWF696_006402 [Orbilia brochopaga]|uniref:Uncharacterized protein n=1 Tax=Orbilia brochopaga TaxID=3140254 RepID=A0AAV9UXF6_9PEZI